MPGLLEVYLIPLAQIAQQTDYLFLGEIGLEKEAPIRWLWIPARITAKSEVLQPFLNRNTGREPPYTPNGKTLLQITRLLGSHSHPLAPLDSLNAIIKRIEASVKVFRLGFAQQRAASFKTSFILIHFWHRPHGFIARTCPFE